MNNNMGTPTTTTIRTSGPTTIRIAHDQFAALITALTGDDKKLSVIVGNANDETVARARGDNAVAAELAKANAVIHARLDLIDDKWMRAYGDSGAHWTKTFDAQSALAANAATLTNSINSVMHTQATANTTLTARCDALAGTTAFLMSEVATIRKALTDLIEALNEDGSEDAE